MADTERFSEDYQDSQGWCRKRFKKVLLVPGTVLFHRKRKSLYKVTGYTYFGDQDLWLVNMDQHDTTKYPKQHDVMCSRTPENILDRDRFALVYDPITRVHRSFD